MNANMNISDFIADTESICFGNGWTRENISSLLDDSSSVCVIEEGIGYALGKVSFEEAELYRIAVLPEYRGKQLGEKLLLGFIGECVRRGAEKVFLEVRSKNVPAVGLYEKVGFKKISVRRNYYGDDDAIIYLFTIPDRENTG